MFPSVFFIFQTFGNLGQVFFKVLLLFFLAGHIFANLGEKLFKFFMFFFLASELEDFAVAVGVDFTVEGWADCRPVFRKKSAGFVANSTGVTEGFGAVRSCPPLRCFLDETVSASPLRHKFL